MISISARGPVGPLASGVEWHNFLDNDQVSQNGLLVWFIGEAGNCYHHVTKPSIGWKWSLIQSSSRWSLSFCGMSTLFIWDYQLDWNWNGNAALVHHRFRFRIHRLLVWSSWCYFEVVSQKRLAWNAYNLEAFCAFYLLRLTLRLSFLL